MFNIAILFKSDYKDYLRRGYNINNLLGDKHFEKKEYDIAIYFYEMSI